MRRSRSLTPSESVAAHIAEIEVRGSKNCGFNCAAQCTAERPRGNVECDSDGLERVACVMGGEDGGRISERSAF